MVPLLCCFLISIQFWAVITSYSIHYTKLYEILSLEGGQPCSALLPFETVQIPIPIWVEERLLPLNSWPIQREGRVCAFKSGFFSWIFLRADDRFPKQEEQADLWSTIESIHFFISLWARLRKMFSMVVSSRFSMSLSEVWPSPMPSLSAKQRFV